MMNKEAFEAKVSSFADDISRSLGSTTVVILAAVDGVDAPIAFSFRGQSLNVIGLLQVGGSIINNKVFEGIAKGITFVDDKPEGPGPGRRGGRCR